MEEEDIFLFHVIFYISYKLKLEDDMIITYDEKPCKIYPSPQKKCVLANNV